MQISNDDLILTIYEDKTGFRLESRRFKDTFLHSQLGILCHVEGRTIDLDPSHSQSSIINQQEDYFTPIGTLTGVTLSFTWGQPNVEARVRLGLLPEEPLALVQIELTNRDSRPLSMDQFTPVQISAGDLHLGAPAQSNPAFYSQGWQSWSHTAVYGMGEKQRRSILGPFQNPMVINTGTPQTRSRNHFSGDMFGVLGDRSSRIGLVAGFLTQLNHFGSLEAECSPQPSLKMWSNGDQAVLMPGETLCTDWASLGFIDLDAPEPLEVYLRSVAKAHHIQQGSPVPVGWCSWYHFYQDISEEKIVANLEAVIQQKEKLPLTLFQIDDGFETYPGDWFDFDPDFPNGFTPIVSATKDAGLTPGVWLAPFIVHPKARLVKEHPDWLLRDKRGKPVNAGFVWNAFTYALDLTHPEALEFCRSVIRTAVKEWGFDYLKLDFLYAAALKGVYRDTTRTRAQVLRSGLEALREAAGPEVMMLACGCPIGSALGLFEAMRISADVSGHWKPHFPPVSPLLSAEPHMPSARNALNNILTRAMLHRRWWINDPDCLLVRADTELTLAEVQTLATAIALTGGSLLLSDDLPSLDAERMQIARSLLPVLPQQPRVLDWFDETLPARLRVNLHGPVGDWQLLALFNWNDHPVELQFSPGFFNLGNSGTWWLREFWTGTIGTMSPESPFVCMQVPPHGVRVMAARKYIADQPAYLGSTLHISQGIEVSQWQQNDHRLAIQFHLGRSVSGSAVLYLPGLPPQAQINSQPCRIDPVGNDLYSIELLDVDGQTLILT